MKKLRFLSFLLALVATGSVCFYAGYRMGERRGVFAGSCGAMEGRGCSPEFRAYSARGEVIAATNGKLWVLDRGRFQKELVIMAGTRLEGWGDASQISHGDHLFAMGRPLSNGTMEVSVIRRMNAGMGGMHRR